MHDINFFRELLNVVALKMFIQLFVQGYYNERCELTTQCMYETSTCTQCTAKSFEVWLHHDISLSILNNTIHKCYLFNF